MAACEAKPRRQCKACPWRKTTVPEEDIPGGYSAQRHRDLIACQADGFKGFGQPQRAMACHEFPPGAEQACVGWVINQIGPGNNIGLRMRALRGDYAGWEIDGEQYETVQEMCDSAPPTKRKPRRATRAGETGGGR